MTSFYMPINFQSVVKKMMTKIEKTSAKTPDWMGLSDHTSKWNNAFNVNESIILSSGILRRANNSQTER
jgi:hypothetical protein